jgi:acyl-CoA thioester hydrolase
VRFAETDAQGIANNSHYLVWFEVARVNYLDRFRNGYQSLRDDGVEAMTIETHVRYLKPAYFDDKLDVHARCVDVRGARFRYEYVIERDGEAIADGWTGHACVDAQTFRPTRVPDWLRAEISRAEAAAEEAA